MTKIVKIEEENLSSYLLNDLMKFSEAFGKNTTFDNIRNHKKAETYHFSKKYIFGKAIKKVQIERFKYLE